MSLDWCIEILEETLPDDRDSSAFATIVRAKGQASQVALTLIARQQETLLKKQALDRLPEILRIIHEEEGKMKVIDSTAVLIPSE